MTTAAARSIKKSKNNPEKPSEIFLNIRLLAQFFLIALDGCP
jgi:hypothetical protein